MIWLRHELWEHHDGQSYRLASKAETDRLAPAHPEAVLKQVFYAPSAAAAVAQFYALRDLGPYIPGQGVSEEPFTSAQLDSQLADFPEDAILSGQPALKSGADAAPTTLHDDTAPVEAAGSELGASEPAEIEPHHTETPAEDVENDAEEPAASEAEPVTAPPVSAEEPLSLAQSAAPPAPHDPLDLWPVAPDEPVSPRWARAKAKRKPNLFLGLLRVILLLIVLGAVVVGIGIVTGRLDGPELLARVRDLSIVRSVLPSA